MRFIREHQINPANDLLQIRVTDLPGQGGANHRYEISGYEPFKNPSHQGNESKELVLLFQNGPIHQFGVNGVTQEALLAVLIDRLDHFQRSPFACPENERALIHLRGAMRELHARTQARVAQGVEGTAEKHQSPAA